MADTKNPVRKSAQRFQSVKVGAEFSTRAFHAEMQKLRQQGTDISLKQFLTETYGADYTPEKFYGELGIDLKEMTVEKMLNTGDLTRYLFPEVFRDAIVIGLQYTPFYSKLVVGEERIESTGITMPLMDWRTVNATNPDILRLRDVHEAATIPVAEVIVWSEKQVTVKKQARGLQQSYESLMFTPINLAQVYFQELGVRLGADLDRALINVAINGDQADLSQSAPVIGAATANTLAYTDIARTWIRFRRIFRNSSVMLMSEADAITVLNMPQFNRIYPYPGASWSGVTLNVQTPLPTSQDIYVHDAVPVGKIIFIDTERFATQLTAMPLLVETERLVSRQINGEYVSIMTGFANLFRDGRIILDYTTSLSTNPGPVPVS